MIFYFSGTGNSKWVAEELAKQTNDAAIDLITVEKASVVPPDTFGLVFPKGQHFFVQKVKTLFLNLHSTID